MDKHTACHFSNISALSHSMMRNSMKLLYGLTSRLVNMHEDHFIIRCQDGVELLVANRGQLGHVPCLTLVH